MSFGPILLVLFGGYAVCAMPESTSVEIATFEAGVPFLIDDGRRRAHVDPERAHFLLRPAAEVLNYAPHALDSDARSAGAGYRDGPAMQVRLSSTADDRLMISDLPEMMGS